MPNHISWREFFCLTKILSQSVFLSHTYCVIFNFVFLPLICSFLIHQCHLPTSFRRAQHSPSLSLITPSEQPIMRFLIWQTGCIIYAELIRHKTHGWISWGILLFNTSTSLNHFKHSVFHLSLSFLCSINALENGTNN